jgi:hypothetical protein
MKSMKFYLAAVLSLMCYGGFVAQCAAESSFYAKA